MSPLLLCLLASFVASVVQAGCDNACSGHGHCGNDGVCECYDNWGMGLSHDSGDCSERICPFDFAWVESRVTNKKGLRHRYAECSGRGICDRSVGDCVCFPGFEGKSCQRTACPNDCSGHGTCSAIDNMFSSSDRLDAVAAQGYSYEDDPYTLKDNGWDSQKTRGCICDPGYGEYDCSKRMCEFGTDPMDNRPNLNVAAKYTMHKITLVGTNAGNTGGAYSPSAPLFATGAITGGTQFQNSLNTFALKFTSALNETFITAPINLVQSASDCHNFTIHVERALLALPNNVIDDVKVAAACGVSNFPGTYYNTNENSNRWYTTLNVTFIGKNVQGKQHLLQPIIRACGEGCYPKLSGLELAPRTVNVTEVVQSDFQSIECGNRGKCDYTSGVCDCFEGYTGAACNIITALL